MKTNEKNEAVTTYGALFFGISGAWLRGVVSGTAYGNWAWLLKFFVFFGDERRGEHSSGPPLI